MNIGVAMETPPNDALYGEAVSLTVGDPSGLRT